jgi:hypothetical protein
MFCAFDLGYGKVGGKSGAVDVAEDVLKQDWGFSA